jgi:hypothetical protein
MCGPDDTLARGTYICIVLEGIAGHYIPPAMAIASVSLARALLTTTPPAQSSG